MIIKSIREALAGRPLVSVSSATTLDTASDIMVSQNVSAVVVLDNGQLVGILTEKDVIRHVSQQGGLSQTCVASVMRTDVHYVETRDSLAHALERMRVGGFRHMPVVDLGQHVIGMLSLRDIPVEYHVMSECCLPAEARSAA